MKVVWLTFAGVPSCGLVLELILTFPITKEIGKMTRGLD